MKKSKKKYPKPEVVVITGAGGGLGKGTAQVFAENDWRVVMIDINQKKLKAAYNQIVSLKKVKRNNILEKAVSVTEYVKVKELIDEIIHTFKGIDVLINIAGVPQAFTDKNGNIEWDYKKKKDKYIAKKQKIEQLTPEKWNDIIDVNLTGVFNMSKAVFSKMKERGSGGYIINISSVAGRKGMKKATAYTASKGALTAFTQALNEEGKKFKIRSSVIYPGGLSTTFIDKKPNKNYLKPQDVGRFFFHIATQASNMVVNEAVITPIGEENYP